MMLLSYCIQIQTGLSLNAHINSECFAFFFSKGGLLLDTISKCVRSYGSCESQCNIHVANCLSEVDAKVFTLRKRGATYRYTANTGTKQDGNVVFLLVL